MLFLMNRLSLSRYRYHAVLNLVADSTRQDKLLKVFANENNANSVHLRYINMQKVKTLCKQTFDMFLLNFSVHFYEILGMLKGLSHEKKQGSKVVSINRPSFKLFPEKVSRIFIQPPSCFLHKTAQRHIIECCELF